MTSGGGPSQRAQLMHALGKPQTHDLRRYRKREKPSPPADWTPPFSTSAWLEPPGPASSSPTAKHDRAETHETSFSLVPPLAPLALGTIDHSLPFRASTSA